MSQMETVICITLEAVTTDSMRDLLTEIMPTECSILRYDTYLLHSVHVYYLHAFRITTGEVTTLETKLMKLFLMKMGYIIW